jgi:tRNA dimethylallyltransferase
LAALTNSDKNVIFVVGPTAAGKSRWALEQAKKYPDSCIVNCDSVQIYKHLDIGSSKPSASELKTRPHYLYSEVDFPRTVTAGQYERLFFNLLESIPEKKIFVVGGTGFYFQAIEKGMYPVSIVKDEVKKEFERLVIEKGFAYLYQWITKIDPEFAKKISINDHYRIERSYQLMRSEDKPMTQIQKEFSQAQRPFPYPLVKIGITEEKETLREMVTLRTKKMLQLGLIDEVKTMLEKGMGSWDPLSSVGYRETIQWLKPPTSSVSNTLAMLESEISTSTMQLIKKQKTWFQRDKDIRWLRKTETVSVF